MNSLLELFYWAMSKILKGNTKYIEQTKDLWEREPYTRKDLQELCRKGNLILTISNDEFERWYNACYFPNAQDKPHIKCNGKKYYIIREDHYDQGSFSGWKFSS
jgi:hypothetical protein